MTRGAAPVVVMTDHPAWRETPRGRARTLCHGAGRCEVLVSHDGTLVTPPPATALDGFRYPADHDLPSPELQRGLAGLGTVHRFRNPSLWDALVTAILRQVIRAEQSKRLYRRLRDTLGTPCACGGGVVLPGPEAFAALPDEEYAALGLAFKARPLRSAAAAYTRHEADWLARRGTDLAGTLAEVRGVGPWTARAAVADYENAWDCYPVDDLAIRTWARRAAPSHPWPDAPADFARHWRELAGEHLRDLTLLLLAWASVRGTLG